MRPEQDVGEGLTYHEDTDTYSGHDGIDVDIDMDSIPEAIADEHVFEDQNADKEYDKQAFLDEYYKKTLDSRSEELWGDHTPFSDQIDLVKGWWNKPEGAPLDSPESKLQMMWGVGEMVVGAVGGVGLLEGSGGTSIFVGLYVMADGGNMFAMGANGVKSNPGTMFIRLVSPVVSDSKDHPVTNPLF